MSITFEPVPLTDRRLFEARLSEATLALHHEGHDPERICQEATRIGQQYPWVEARTVANALVDALGPGWGAIYLHWLWSQDDDA